MYNSKTPRNPCEFFQWHSTMEIVYGEEPQSNPILKNIEKDDPKVREALLFAAGKHLTQTRKNKAQTPYIEHPLAVYNILVDIVPENKNVLIAALLHDTVEDTKTTLEEIEEKFGKEVRELVAKVTDDRSLSKVERKKAQIEHAANLPEGAALVKLADKLANLRDSIAETPMGWTKEIAKGYFVWAWFVTDAIKLQTPAVLKLKSLLKELFESKVEITVPGETEGFKLPLDPTLEALNQYYLLIEQEELAKAKK